MHREISIVDETDGVSGIEYPDYFAELYVAGLMAHAGWNIYFPHRDRGLDFIASKTGADRHQIIRPVQVKGKYPEVDKTNKKDYGFVGRLNQIHPDMVLAMPFFAGADFAPPVFVAFMPYAAIKPHKRGYRCQPAYFKDGRPFPKPNCSRYIGKAGLDLIERSDALIR